MSSNLLKSILGSKTRLKLLRIFLWNAETEFYLRELQSLLSEDLTAIRREVSKLHDEKLLSRVNRGNRVYYQINISHDFFTPLRDLFFASEGVAGKIVQILSEKVPLSHSRDVLDHVVVYGEESDLLSRSSWNILFVGQLSSEKLLSIENAFAKLGKKASVKYMKRVDYDEALLAETSELDEIFEGNMIEIMRNRIYL